MSLFSVPEMHCDGCIRSLTAAIRDLDPAAEVRADLAKRQVAVHAKAPDAAIAEAMRDAGFDVEEVKTGRPGHSAP